MNKFILMGTAAMITMGANAASAQGLALGSETTVGADVSVEAPLLGDTHANTNAKTHADMNAGGEASHDKQGSTHANTHGEMNADAHSAVAVETEADENAEEMAKDVKTEAEMTVEEKKAEAEARINNARGDASSRIQDIEGRTQTGAQATANTKIDVQ